MANYWGELYCAVFLIFFFLLDFCMFLFLEYILYFYHWIIERNQKKIMRYIREEKQKANLKYYWNCFCFFYVIFILDFVVAAIIFFNAFFFYKLFQMQLSVLCRHCLYEIKKKNKTTYILQWSCMASHVSASISVQSRYFFATLFVLQHLGSSYSFIKKKNQKLTA